MKYDSIFSLYVYVNGITQMEKDSKAHYVFT